MDILVELSKLITTLQSAGEVKNNIGDVSKLSTKEKQNLVFAINELNEKYGEINKGNIDEKIKPFLSLLDTKVNSKDLESTVRKVITDGNFKGEKGEPGKQGEPGIPGKQGEPGIPGGSGGYNESSRMKWLKQTEYSELQFKNQLDPNIEYHITDRPTAYSLQLVGAELRLAINGATVAACNVTTLLNK